jgi:AcrR family transcriptional regulator
MNPVGTKERILDIARNLFADKGYDGVSIREISHQADVNLAAINYHFTNKKNLYEKTIEFSMGKVANDVQHLYTDKISVEDFTLKLYEYFTEHSPDLRIGYKMMLNNPETFGELTSNAEHPDTIVGPPGGSVFFNVIKNHYPGAQDADLYWAVRIIYGAILHKCMLACSNIYQSRVAQFPDAYTSVEDEILRLVKVVLNDLHQQ